MVNAVRHPRVIRPHVCTCCAKLVPNVVRHFGCALRCNSSVRACGRQ